MVDIIKNEDLMEAIEQFYFAYRSFTAGPDRVLQERSLGRVHHRILYFVGRNPHISVNALLSVLAVSKQALNGPLRVLVDQGLVNTEMSTEDRRIKQLTLSPEGRKLERQLTRIQMQQLDAVFSRAGRKPMQCWLDIMREIPRVGPL
ncbi:MAG: MarR family transcriptional regulator [Pseudohongiellaceae bacterium]